MWTIHRNGNAETTIGDDTWRLIKSLDDYWCIYKNTVLISKVLAPREYMQDLVDVLIGRKLLMKGSPNA